MLVSYRIKNYKGFGKEQVFDLRATSQNDFPETTYEINKLIKVNKKACLIGPNGSGKSHLLRSLTDLLNAVHSGELQKLSSPFQLNDENPNEPTVFDIILYSKAAEQFLTYSLSVLKEAVLKESLYCRANGKHQHNKMIFSRDENTIEIAPEYESLKTITNKISESRLVVDVLSGLDVEPIDNFLSYSSKILLITPERLNMGGAVNIVEASLNHFVNQKEADQEFIERLFEHVKTGALENLNKFGIEVENIDILLNKENKVLISITPTSFSKIKPTLTLHQCKDFFSSGSFNLINLFLLVEILKGYPILVLLDEIDSTFHHKISRQLLSMLGSDEGFDGAQLVIATHDIMLLDCEFRRDAIYTLQKDNELNTVINRVSDYSIRKDAKLSLKYLADEFGSLPKFLEN
ncbi:TPA: ATP/GTP-binding protein [Vibrio diabolicus]